MPFLQAQYQCSWGLECIVNNLKTSCRCVASQAPVLGMAKVPDEEVRQVVRRILEGADLESISERKIKDQIAEKYGDIEPFKDLIRVSPITPVSQ